MRELGLRVAYWVFVVINSFAFSFGLDRMLTPAGALGVIVGIALAWHPLGLVVIIPVALDGYFNQMHTPAVIAIFLAFAPAAAALAFNDFAAFRVAGLAKD